MLKKIAISGGVVKDDTAYSSEGKWVDSDKVRFYNGRPQKIGGWEKNNSNQFAGSARALHSWRDYNDNRLIAIGTNTNLYILKDEVLYNITPEDPSHVAVTVDLQASEGFFFPVTTNTNYGESACYYPRGYDSSGRPPNDWTGTNLMYGSSEYDYGWTYQISPSVSDGTYSRTDTAIIRIYKASHGLSSNDSKGTPIAYYFNNINIGEVKIAKLSSVILNNSTNYFDIALPSGYDSGTTLNYNAFSQIDTSHAYSTYNDNDTGSKYLRRTTSNKALGIAHNRTTNYSGQVTGYSNRLLHYCDGFHRTGIGLGQTYIYFDAPFDSSGNGIQFSNSISTSSAYWTERTNPGTGDTYLFNGTATSGANDDIGVASIASLKAGNVVTDKNNVPCARRFVVTNRNDPNLPGRPSGSWWQSVSNYHCGVFKAYNWWNSNYLYGFPQTSYVVVTGKTYKGNTISETIYIPVVATGNPSSYRRVNYSMNWFTEIDRITIYPAGSTGAASGSSNVWEQHYWDFFGTVNFGLSRETMSTAYDANPATIPAISSGGSTDITITKPIDAGEAHSNYAYGWGVGVWEVSGGGSGRTWGTPAGTSSVVVDPRVWSFDNFGEDLVATYNGGLPFYWDASTGTGTKAVQISNATSTTTPQANGTGTSPTSCKSIFVSSPDRHIVILGAVDPMTVQWASQETTNVWTTTVETDTSGSQILTGGTYLVGWSKVRGQTLLFSDNNVHGMVYQGPPYTFGFKELGNNCGLISPNGSITVQGRCFWMGFKNFFLFDGGVKVLPSPVAKFVFEDFNYTEQMKVFTGTSKGYNEIWWFYPSLSVNTETTSLNASMQNREINRYVKYNYLENLWDIGTFSRTAWEGGTVFENDISADTDAYLYNQEVGTSSDGTAFTSFIESADFDIDDGNNLMFVDKALPDATLTDKVGDVVDETFKITFSSRKDSFGDYTDKGPFTVRSRDVTIEGTNYSKTGRINPRVRGRQMKMKIESDGLHDHWRLGDMRLDMRPDGER